MWVNYGMGADGAGGRLVGGSENGALTVYNPDVIVKSGADAIVGESDKHTGPIRALDFNPFQVNVCDRQPPGHFIREDFFFSFKLRLLLNIIKHCFLSQSNLLASGANDSEIYIWDLNNFSSPMTPGAKSQVGVCLCVSD